MISDKNKETANKIIDEIHEIITSIDKIQYTEFVAFWKALDMSFSIFKKLPNQKAILTELLKKYCLRRRKLYDKLGYSNITVQALYDSGASRKKRIAGITKVLDLADKILNFKKDEHLKQSKKLREKVMVISCRIREIKGFLNYFVKSSKLFINLEKIIKEKNQTLF